MARTSRPYSSSYSSSITGPGSLPFFLTGTKPAPSCWASAPPKMNPRDSTPTTTSTLAARYRAARWSITERHASPSLRSVVMSLKRMPSVGKSLISRIFAVSEATSMTGRDLTCRLPVRQHEMLAPSESSAEQAVDEVTEIGDDEVGVGGRRPASRGEVDTAHPGFLRSRDVGVGIVADVSGMARLGAEPGERSPEDLGIGLPVANLVRVRDRGEVAKEIVAVEHLAQDDPGRTPRVGHDAERDPARGQLRDGLRRAGMELGRKVKNWVDVALHRLVEHRAGEASAESGQREV